MYRKIEKKTEKKKNTENIDFLLNSFFLDKYIEIIFFLNSLSISRSLSDCNFHFFFRTKFTMHHSRVRKKDSKKKKSRTRETKQRREKQKATFFLHVIIIN